MKFKERIKNKKVLAAIILVIALIVAGGAIYANSSHKTSAKKVHKPKKAVSKEVADENSGEESSAPEAVPAGTSDKAKENPKPEKNSSAKSAAKSGSNSSASNSFSGSSSSGQTKAKEPIYGTRTVTRQVQVWNPTQTSYIQCACGCKNPSYDHTKQHMLNGEPSNTKRVYVGGYDTKTETVTERYIIGYK